MQICADCGKTIEPGQPSFWTVLPVGRVYHAILSSSRLFQRAGGLHPGMAPDRHAGSMAGAIMKAEGGKWKIISGWLAAN